LPAAAALGEHDTVLWRRRDSRITNEDFLDLVRFLMEMDAKLNKILDEMGIGHGED